MLTKQSIHETTRLLHEIKDSKGFAVKSETRSAYNTIESNANVANVFSCVNASTLAQSKAIQMWVNKRLEAIDDGNMTIQSLKEYGSSTSTLVPEDVVDNVIPTRLLDEGGLVHGFTKSTSGGTSSIKLDGTTVLQSVETSSGTKYYWVSQDSIDLVNDFADLSDEQAAIQSEFASYCSLCASSVDQSGEIAMSAVTAGLNSTDDRIREVAAAVSANGNNLGSLAAYLYDVFNNVIDVAKSNTEGDVGTTFNYELSQYSAARVKDVMAGVWTIMANVASVGFTILAVVGGAIGKTIGFIGMGISTAVRAISDSVAKNTTMSYGDGSSDGYAVGYKVKIPSSWLAYASDTKPQTAIYLPWGQILLANREVGDDNVAYYPAVIFPSCYHVPYSPLGSDVTSGDMNDYSNDYVLFNEESTNFTYDKRKTWLIKNSANGYGDVPTTQEQLWNNVISNFGSIAIWLGLAAFKNLYATQIMALTSTSSIKVTRSVLKADLTSVIHSHNTDDIGRMATYLSAAISPDKKNFFSASMSDNNSWVSNTLGGGSDVKLFNDIAHFCYVYSGAPTDTVLQQDIFQMAAYIFNYCKKYMLGHTVSDLWNTSLFNSLGAGQMMLYLLHIRSGSSVAVGVSRTEQRMILHKGTDLYAIGSDSPEIPKSFLISPPNLSQASLWAATALILATVIVTVTAALLVRRAVRTRMRTKCLRREQAAIDAQEAFKNDPSKANAAAYLKAQRKFTRYANKVGYSSNNVGSFQSSAAGIASAASTLEDLDVNNAYQDALNFINRVNDDDIQESVLDANNGIDSVGDKVDDVYDEYPTLYDRLDYIKSSIRLTPASSNDNNNRSLK